MNMPPECAKHELPLQELQSGNGLGVPMEFFFRCDDCKSNFGRQDKWELQDRAERRAQQRLNDGSWIDAGKRISDARSGTAT